LFNIAALAELEPAAYEALAPVQWPVRARAPRSTPRLFADGRFMHADGRAHLVPTPPHAPAHAPDEEYPLALNTGRIRDQWHTMTRSGLAARLGAHLPEPFVDLHPQDALVFGLHDGSLVRVATRWGRMVGRLRCSGEVRRGEVFVPIHWSDSNASDARVGALVNPVVDPLSGEPEFKHTPARVEAFVVAWQGFVLTRAPLHTATFSWWARAQGEGHLRYELAGRHVPAGWGVWARAHLGVPASADWLEFADAHAGLFRGAWLRDGRLEACVCIAPRAELLPDRSWLAAQFVVGAITGELRNGLLLGRAPGVSEDAGPTVCSCFGVGRNRILAAIAAGCQDAMQIGSRLKAGTNCGSCVPELRRLIAEAKAAG
jgi:assimilatory nitrate reductase catalytic subunit